MNMVKTGGETGQQIVDNMSSQQSTSSTSNNIYVTNNNPQKELIEDKKRKMTLPLDSGGGGDGQMNSQNQNNLTLQQGSNMLTGFTPTNNKKIKTYFTPVGLVNAPSNNNGIYPFSFHKHKKGELKQHRNNKHSKRKETLLFIRLKNHLI